MTKKPIKLPHVNLPTIDTLNKAQVEKDEGLEAEALPRLLIVAEGPN